MRFSSLAYVVLASAGAVDAFVPAAVVQKAKASAPASPSRQVLSMTKKSADYDNVRSTSTSTPMWGAAAMASVASWGMAAQLASASMAPIMLPASSTSYQETSIMSSQPTTLISAFETMDFGMPSYGGATKGDVTSSKLGAPPSFNPFGDAKPEVVSSPEAASSTSKADDAATQAADKKAADADKKAATAKKKAEDKAARRLAEMEKQKAYAERSKAEPSSSKFEVPDLKIPDFKKPDMPEISIPELKAPDISIPDIKAPDMSKMSFSMPKMSMPKIDMPEMSMPKLDMPKIDMPKIDMPKMPKMEAPSGGGYDLDVPDSKAPGTSNFDMPKISMPSMPKVDMPSMPKVDMSSMPKVDLPSMPKVSLPSLPNPFGGGSKSDGDGYVAPQDDRDESARQARGVYLEADQEAKTLEQQARELRDAAKAKKQLANLAKDEACKTRPGGKLICLRNPFKAGF